MNGPQIHFFGALTRDPEELPIGDDTYARLLVGVETHFHDAREPETLGFWVHIFGHEADSAMERCRKGQSVYVNGRYSQITYRDQNHTLRCVPLIIAKEFHVVS